MTTNYHRNYYRAALSVAAAATTFIASHAGAQMLGINIFGGTNGSQTAISTNAATLSASTVPVTGPVGPGFTGTVVLNAAVLDTLTETINVNNNATMTVEETGPGVLGIFPAVGAGGSFAATKSLGVDFVPNQSYSFTLTTTTNSALNLLSGLNVVFSAGGATPPVYSASGGTGLLGVAQVLNLFGGTGNTATINFTAPANVNTTAPITVTISGGLTAAALGNTFTFTNGVLNAVPEPGTVGAMGVGIAALALLRFRHRLAKQ